ncbi:MAG TPA: hypothetical protein ENK91_01730, partial [Bacteroidetes bacterium]|nr:hypothetical protein [Bacteroidota bacterium]
MKFLLSLKLLLIFNVFVYSQITILNSNKKQITYLINGKEKGWTIAPEVNPDILRIYCGQNYNSVTFKTDIDSIEYIVSDKDTIKFSIILNKTDTAYTQIIGIKEIPNTISNKEKIYWLSQIWSEIKYNFVNIDHLKFNLDSMYNIYIPEVLNTNNDYEYYQVLKKFVASLQDGHSAVYNNNQFSIFMDYIPMSIEDINKKLYITSIRKGIGLDSSYIGAEIIEIDKIPTIEYISNRVFPYIAASTEQHLWMQAPYYISRGFKNDLFKATIRKTDGKIEEIEIKRNGSETRTPKDEYWGPKFKFSRKYVDLEWSNDSIAIIGINRFYPEEIVMNDIDDAINKTKKAKGVIIDLRRNGGGSTLVAWNLQKHLTKGNFFLNYGWDTRISDGVRKANGNWKDEYKDYYKNKAIRYEKPDTVFVEDSIYRIKVPVVILIGRYTFSAAEDFLVNIYEVPNRPVLIGEETGGSTGSPLVISGLPGNGYARICTRRICYPY